MHSTVIPVSTTELWNRITTHSRYYDFYHCNSYNCLNQEGVPFLFVSQNENDFIALPLVKRAIEGTTYFDCTSVYGYPGPIASNNAKDLNPALIDFFQKEIKEYMSDNKIISVFSRLHTIIEQELYLKSIGEITQLNKTVAIDLSLPPDVQRQQYRKSNKSEINQLRRTGYLVKKAETIEEIDAFVEIYAETMHRVKASSFYFDYFDSEYFHNLLNLRDANPLLLIALKEEEIIAGGIFIASKSFMQYHVAGTKEEHIKATPMKLIIDEARLLANQMNLEYLHLGGGVNGSDSDSLFRFKAGFSNITFTYKTWKYIIDEAIYNNLVEIKLKEKELNKSYFPLYRA